MSDLQDLIHKTSMDCIERGKKIERERITREIQKTVDSTDSGYVPGLYKALELIKGEANGS
jgi:hypothetical protein